MTFYSRWLLLLAFLLVTGCTVIGVNYYDELFGPEQIQDRLVADTSADGNIYLNQVKPILESRCVVCHGCYDAPCQLKLSSPAGIDRGLSKALVYDGTRLLASEPSRIFVDAQTTKQWRDKGFKPVLNERQQLASTNIAAGLLAQSLLLKQKNPLPEVAVLGDEFNFALDREQTCPSSEEYSHFAQQKPHAGMPYGLPAISEQAFTTLDYWLKQGGKMASIPAPDQGNLAEVAKWEAFFNQHDNKSQLMSRYIYEHWFLAHLHFPQYGSSSFFKLVRSSTPPGQPIQVINTRRPYENPKVKPVYYRLMHDTQTILAKTHLPLALNDAKLARLEALFLTPDYQVNTLPSYQAEVASNPFKAFTDLPIKSRYQFLLDDAQLYIMGFIKGPVCRGQVALNVINDNFWVVFADPDITSTLAIDHFLTFQKDMLALPAKDESNATAFNWLSYAHRESKYVEAKGAISNLVFEKGKNLNEQLIWQGQNYNDNAALTIFRHNDSASVVKGLVGENPKTAWVMDYPLFERIHYLLVAGFDVYGNVGHQLTTRLYMDFLRLEGEKNFLALLPLAQRKKIHDYWYRKASPNLVELLKKNNNNFVQPSGIQYQTDDPQAELYSILKKHLKYVNKPVYQVESESPLLALNSLPSQAVNLLPQVSFILVKQQEGYQAYTLLHNNAHYNISSLLNEAEQREYSQDKALIVKGFIGDYPAAIWHITDQQQADFVTALAGMTNEQHYRDIKTRFAIRRTHPNFWFYSDLIHQLAKQEQGIAFGLFDYNRLENR